MKADTSSQCPAGVSPAMHRESAMEYEKRLGAPFARIGYGCCKDLTAKRDDVLTIPRIRRVSISPLPTWTAAPLNPRGSRTRPS